MSDPVKHPDHYTWLPGVECIDVVRHFNFNLGGAIKYIWRSGKKDDAVQDLRKAIQLLENEIDRLEHDESVGDVEEPGQRPIPSLESFSIQFDGGNWEELGFTIWEAEPSLGDVLGSASKPFLFIDNGKLRISTRERGGEARHAA